MNSQVRLTLPACYGLRYFRQSHGWSRKRLYILAIDGLARAAEDYVMLAQRDDVGAVEIFGADRRLLWRDAWVETGES